MYEVLIAHLRECAKYDKSENTYKEAADAIERLKCFNALWQEAAKIAHENEMKWIPVTERLPDENGFYLVLYRHKYPGGIAMDEGLGIIQWYDARWKLNEIYAVTHWMPLPEPPKEET